MNNQATPSTQASAKPRKRWTELEERTLIDGLKDLCVRGWRGDNGTFRHGHLIELEHYICARLPNCQIKALPHIDSKVRTWKKNYGTISSLTSRSGLGFQYSDGCIVVDDQKAWEDYTKSDPNAKGMNSKTWPFYADWEEIFGKDRATGEFAEGPLDAVEEMERNQEVPNVMRLGYPIVIVDEDDVGDGDDVGGAEDVGDAEDVEDIPANGGDKATQNGPGVSTGAAKRPFTGTTQGGGPQQGNTSKASSSKAKERGKDKRRRTAADEDNEILLKFVEVMKQHTENSAKNMATLIEKLGERDLSGDRKKVYSILESPAFSELYSPDQRCKAGLAITRDVHKMEYFLNAGEIDRLSIVWMGINDKL